jgi:hypothetical protein
MLFFSSKADARVKLAKTGHSFKLVVICVVLMLFMLYVLFVSKCVLCYCHRVSTQLQLTNISYRPISRPTDATCDRFLFSIYMCITVYVLSVKRSPSGVPHRTYSLQFVCLCLSAALPQTDTNTETGCCM